MEKDYVASTAISAFLITVFALIILPNAAYAQDATFPSTTTVVFDDAENSQMIVSGDDVYFVWVDPQSQGGKPDVFFKASHDNGVTFDPPINLSDNIGFSSEPQIAVSEGRIYVVWSDDIRDIGGDNEEIFLRISSNNGVVFGSTINLSESFGRSHSPQLFAVGPTLHVVWEEEATPVSNAEIFYRRTANAGISFEPIINLSDNAGKSQNPQIDGTVNQVYVTWEDDTPG
ncbi:MAG: hypothetical protein ACE5RJ_00580, partial [Nitrosopumilaceae archaeon]